MSEAEEQWFIISLTLSCALLNQKKDRTLTLLQIPSIVGKAKFKDYDILSLQA